MKLKYLATLLILSGVTLCQLSPTKQPTETEVKQEVKSEPVAVAKTVEPQDQVEEEEHLHDDCDGQEVMLEVSYYCACAKCCDVETGITASGARVQSGVTVAMPSSVPFGTKVYIEELDHVFTVQDRGGYIKQLDDNTMRVDVYVDSHELALELGRHMSRGILYY